MSDRAENDEPKRYAWTVDGEMDSGTLQKYADLWKRNHYGGDFMLSTKLIIWDGDGTPFLVPVSRRYTHTDEGDFMHYEFTVRGDDPAYAIIDGRA